MADQMEELIREIAAKHGIAVSRDDPILILQTINSRLLQESAKAQQEQLDRYKEELEALSLRWSTDAKNKAERILNTSLSASKDAMGQVARDSASAATSALRAEIDAVLARVDSRMRDARQISMLNIAASCVTLIAAVIALSAILR